MLDIGNVNKPSEVKARVLAGKSRTALEVNHFRICPSHTDLIVLFCRT